MKILRIERLEEVTIGVLIFNGSILCYTLEKPWISNKRNESCIPTGVYGIKRVESPRFGNTFQVLDVKDRTDILFHTGNTVDDTDGCILLGKAVGRLNDKRAVINSKRSFSLFMEALDRDFYFLEIRNA